MFKPVLELRERYERRLDKDFALVGTDNRSDVNTRWRFGLDFTHTKGVTGKVVFQYGHNLGWTLSKNSSKENSDLLYAYADLKQAGGTWRLGRQPLSKGGERLLERGEWGNTTRSWDMVRLTTKALDAWVGRLAVNSTPSRDAYLAGFAAKNAFGETMALYKHDDRAGAEDDIFTLDHRWTSTGTRWTVEAEGALQRGRVGTNGLEAWAGAAKASFKSTQNLTFIGEVSAASGGKRGNTVLTYDQLYPGNHSKYGQVDVQGFRNMKGLMLGFQYRASAATTFRFEFHKFALMAADDAWYGDNGKPNSGVGGTFIDPSGTSGRDVGHEFNVTVGHKLSDQAAIDAGVGLFKPGRFVSAFANSGDRNQVWGFFQVRYKF